MEETGSQHPCIECKMHRPLGLCGDDAQYDKNCDILTMFTLSDCSSTAKHSMAATWPPFLLREVKLSIGLNLSFFQTSKAYPLCTTYRMHAAKAKGLSIGFDTLNAVRRSSKTPGCSLDCCLARGHGRFHCNPLSSGTPTWPRCPLGWPVLSFTQSVVPCSGYRSFVLNMES